MSTLFPIGHYTGVRPSGGHAVRVGRGHVSLTEAEFGLWILAHAEIDDVATPAAEAGVSADVDRLAAAGVLAVVRPETVPDFVAAYRLSPLMVGIGEHDGRYRVGLGAAAVDLDAPGYELWQWGHLVPSLQHAAEVRARVTGRPVPEVLDGVLRDLRVLLAHSCAYLDLA